MKAIKSVFASALILAAAISTAGAVGYEGTIPSEKLITPATDV